MASNRRPAPAPVAKGAGTPDLENRDIRELPGAFDEEIGVIFREMRDASGLGKHALARKLNTSVRTLDALEQGALLALPAWSETSRVILAYTGLLGLDGQPILRRINGQFAARGTRPARAAVGAHPGEPVAGGEPDAPSLDYSRFAAGARDEVMASRSGRRAGVRRGRGAFWTLVLAMVAAGATGVLYASQRPALVLSVTDTMPDPLARMARMALEGESRPAYADPRSRKADRLPVRGEDRPAMR